MRKIQHQQPLIAITLIAFMVNALLPFFALYSVPVQARAFSAPPTSSISQPRGDEQVSPSAANPAGLFTDKVLICTAQGFKWVSLSELR